MFMSVNIFTLNRYITININRFHIYSSHLFVRSIITLIKTCENKMPVFFKVFAINSSTLGIPRIEPIL